MGREHAPQRTPLSIGGLPRTGDQVLAYGFPQGGTRVTITRGVVSRIDRQSYGHSSHQKAIASAAFRTQR